MKKIFTLVAAVAMAAGVQAQTVEKYEAVTYDGSAYTASPEFANAVIADGKSVVTFGTANMDVVAVGGTTAKDVEGTPGGAFPGWSEWNDVKWDVKNQGDITFGYILGTGNPAVSFEAEEVLTDGEPTGRFRPVYEFYEADGSKGLPVMGLYYKFTAKAAGELKLYVWSNKNNRNTFLVDQETKQSVKYTVEGYINGQNYPEGYEDASLVGKKKWLTADEIQAIHDASGNANNPYVIGAGNQPFWGCLTYTVTAGQTLWLFQHSSQIGFQKYEFTPNGTSGINEVAVAANSSVAYNIAGQRVAPSVKGLVIVNGKKIMNK